AMLDDGTGGFVITLSGKSMLVYSFDVVNQAVDNFSFVGPIETATGTLIQGISDADVDTSGQLHVVGVVASDLVPQNVVESDIDGLGGDFEVVDLALSNGDLFTVQVDALRADLYRIVRNGSGTITGFELV